jgi:NAD-dependent dihydropyrimidine dehydrogenase PreA subunit
MIMVEIALDHRKCKGKECGICAYICPTNVFAIKNNEVLVNSPQYCKLCYECLETCPTAALNIKKTEGSCV